VKDFLLGEFDITGMPAKFSIWPEEENLKADLLGVHNEQILSEIWAARRKRSQRSIARERSCETLAWNQ